MNDATVVVHAGRRRAPGEAPLPAPVFASHFVAPESVTQPYAYGREDHPTYRAYEAALSELEGGDAGVFASGIAAIDAVFGTVLRPGDTLVIVGDGYFASRSLAESYAAAQGINVRYAPSSEPGSAPAPGVPAARDDASSSLAGARLVWIETPSNPLLEVVDVAAYVRAAHEAGALIAVDNTTATPLGTRPLALGADFSVSSDSKMMTGHGDLILGHVAGNDPARMRAVAHWRQLHGAIAGPMEVFLAHRSLATLQLRLERSSANAMRIAEFLAGRSDVSDVRYPGLPSFSAHAVAARQMRYFGPVLGFDAGPRERAARFLESLRLVTEATSFGSVITNAERRARWGGDAVTEGFIRLSAGCEDAGDLIDDLRSALDANP